MAASSSPARVGSHALLEREAELGRLRELIVAAAQGHGAAAVVVGPAGIGKTSLLTAGQDLSRELGLLCLSARGGELEQDLPYGVVRQLFELPLHRLPDAERRHALEGAAAFAMPVVGVETTIETQGPDSTFSVVHGLYWLTMNLAQRAAVALTVDDVHWADAASLRFLAYLQRRLEDLPVLVVTAARAPADTPHAELVDSVTAAPWVHGLTLASLSEGAVSTILQSSLGRAPEDTLVRACYQATSGNPFLCAILASTLAEQGASDEPGQGARVTELARGSLSNIIVGRLGRLSPAAAGLARAVAILGTDVEFRHAAALADLDARDAATAADALAARGIVRAGAGIDFVHPLVRAAVRDSLPAAKRALLHARAAQLLAREGAPPERVAIHLLAAEPAAQPWVTESLRAAARLVAARGDPQTAASYLRRALREPPQPSARAAVLHELGVAEIHAGQSEPAARSLDEAHRLAEDATQRAHIARDLALALTTPGRYQEAVAVLVDTLEDATGLERDLTLQLEAELHQSAMMEPLLYRAVNARLDRLDHEVAGNTPGERSLMAALATEELLRTLDAARVRERARLAFERGLLDDHLPYSALWGNAAFPLIVADGFTEARAVSTQAIQDARRRGSPVNSTRAHAVSAMLHLREGAVRDAESDALSAVELGLQAGFAVSLISLGVLIESRVERGELAAAEAALMEAGMGGEIADRFRDNWVLYARGRLRQAQGRTDEAIADFEELGGRGERGWRPWNPALFAYRSCLALALLSSGERKRASELADEELALSRRWGAARAIGVSLRTLGLVANGDRGIALLRASVNTLHGSGAQLEHARSLVDLGAAIRRSGKRSEAREPLHAGMELAHHCGAAPLAERAHEELLATGARPRRVMRSGVDALTPSERRVARMAAEGMTNREIAQALFVTLRTVQVHLTHTYQKLAISSREDLPTALAAQPTPRGHATSQ